VEVPIALTVVAGRRQSKEPVPEEVLKSLPAGRATIVNGLMPSPTKRKRFNFVIAEDIET
jgi:hypothetical protein